MLCFCFLNGIFLIEISLQDWKSDGEKVCNCLFFFFHMSLSKQPDMKHAEVSKNVFIDVNMLRCEMYVHLSSARVNSSDVRLRNRQQI